MRKQPLPVMIDAEDREVLDQLSASLRVSRGQVMRLALRAYALGMGFKLKSGQVVYTLLKADPGKKKPANNGRRKQ